MCSPNTHVERNHVVSGGCAFDGSDSNAAAVTSAGGARRAGRAGESARSYNGCQCSGYPAEARLCCPTLSVFSSTDSI